MQQMAMKDFIWKISKINDVYEDLGNRMIMDTCSRKFMAFFASKKIIENNLISF